jgi:hypothetical protein
MVNFAQNCEKLRIRALVFVAARVPLVGPELENLKSSRVSASIAEPDLSRAGLDRRFSDRRLHQIAYSLAGTLRMA